MLSVLVPLYAVAVGLSAAEIGLIVAARSVLPTALSIHGGILMDEWGTQRVLWAVAIACAVLPLAYPITGWFTVLVVLQLLIGLASSLAMAGAQTWSMQTSGGDTAGLARFSLYSRFGTFLAPVTVGAVWDLMGAWAAFSSVSLWAAGILISLAHAAPMRRSRRTKDDGIRAGGPVVAALLPRWAPHKSALALAAVPAVAFVLAVSFLRNAPGGIQASLYVVYLGEIGFSGTLIGALVSTSELFGVFGSMAAALLERFMRARYLLIVCIASSVLAITLTPLIASLLVLLFAAAALRGIAQGASQPVMYSVLSRAVPDSVHGASVGLRNAVTRLASILTPAGMGIAADAWGIEASFCVTGAVLLVLTACLALAARTWRIE
jgi:MFS family permease